MRQAVLRRRSRQGSTLAALLALAALLQPTPVPAERRVITLSAAQLTSQLRLRFPQRNCLLGLACVTVIEPTVTMAPGDQRLFVDAQVKPELGAQALAAGSIELAGKPRYDAIKGAFFLDEPVVSKLRFPDLAPTQAATAAELTRSLLVEYFRQTPVWVLDERDAQQAMVRLVLRRIAVEDGTLRFTIGDDE